MAATIANALMPIFGGLLLGYLAGNTPMRDLRAQAAPALVLAIAYTTLYAISFFWSRSRQHLTAADSDRTWP
jgi:malonate transporter and related proteins